MAINRWWAGNARERFWLESTDRADLGHDLRAPQTDDSGRENWRYTLLREMRRGEIVLHYHKDDAAIVAVSQVAEEAISIPIVWGARGTVARTKGVQPYERPGLGVALAGFRKLARPIVLQEIRDRANEIARAKATLEQRYGTLYFPFELSAKRAPRALQGYAFKLPFDFVCLFPSLLAEVVGPPYPLDDNELAALTTDSSELRSRAHRIRLRGPISIPAGQMTPRRVEVVRAEFYRDPTVAAYVRERADGFCELCKKAAPFTADDGEPYLEVHHILTLAELGPDTPDNAAALCPNCHRELHHGVNSRRLREALLSRLHALGTTTGSPSETGSGPS
jgi:hypothetical protein